MLQERPTSLLDATLTHLRGWDQNLAELARKTGLGYFWLRKLKHGEIKNPGILQIEKLHAFFTKNELKDAA